MSLVDVLLAVVGAKGSIYQVRKGPFFPGVLCEPSCEHQANMS